MKKKKIGLLLLPVLIAAIVGGIILAQTTETKAEPTPDGYLALEDAPGVNLINSTTGLADDELPPEYGAYFQLNKDTSYEPLNVTTYDMEKAGWISTPGESHSYVFQASQYPSNVERSVTIHNAGFYQGRAVDVKLVVDRVTGYRMTFHGPLYKDKDNDGKYLFSEGAVSDFPIGNLFMSFLQTSLGKGYWASSISPGATTDYHWEFYDAETQLPLNYKGLWNARNINNVKVFTVEKSDDDFSNFYVPNNSRVGYVLSDGLLKTTGVGDDQYELFHTYSYSFEGTTLSQSFTKGPLPPNETSGALGVYYDSRPISRIGHAQPAVRGVTNSATHAESGYQDLHYQIVQTVSNNDIQFRDNSFVIDTTLPSTDFDVDLSRITVTNEISGADVTSDFDISGSGQNLSISPKDPTSDEFNGNTFTIDVYGTPNSSFDVLNVQNGYVNNSASVDNGYMVFDLDATQTTLTYETDAFGEKVYDSIVDGNASQAKTLYEGIPSATPKSGLTIEPNGDIETVFANPGTSMLDNLVVDTNNDSFDEPVTVTFETPLPSTATEGTITVNLTLTTARGVERTVAVPVLVGANTATLTATDNTGRTDDYYGQNLSDAAFDAYILGKGNPELAVTYQGTTTNYDYATNPEYFSIEDYGGFNKTSGAGTYTITVASDVNAGINVGEKVTTTFDLTITDMTQPIGTGRWGFANVGGGSFYTDNRTDSDWLKQFLISYSDETTSPENIFAQGAIADTAFDDQLTTTGRFTTTSTSPYVGKYYLIKLYDEAGNSSDNVFVPMIVLDDASIDATASLAIESDLAATGNITEWNTQVTNNTLRDYLITKYDMKAWELDMTADLTNLTPDSDVKADESKFTIDTSGVDASSSMTNIAQTITLTLTVDGRTVSREVTITFGDDQAPTADPANQRINILNAADLEAMDPRDFVTNIQDNVSVPADVTVEFVGTPDFETIVATTGDKTIQVRLTDEAGNSATVDVTITVYDNRITVNFIDGDNKVLETAIQIAGRPTEPINLATNAEVLAKISSVTNQGYTLETTGRPNPETVTFTETTQSVNYLFSGILAIESAPSSIDFGTIVFDATVQRRDNPNLNGEKLVISDNRARVDGGWTLTATLTKEMTNDQTKSVMSNALVYVDANLKEVPLSKEAQTIAVNATGGNQVITDSWGTTADSEGLKLIADPSETTFSNLGSYNGQITWTVTAGP
ncbi:mucin-binding protein [Enterococcus sp. LJL120]